MEKFALELLTFFGWPALILCAGLLLDFICSKNFKTEIAVRLGKRQRIGNWRKIIRNFNRGFLAPLLGNSPFTRKFFLRSALVSLLALPAVATTQLYMYNIRLIDVFRLNNNKEFIFVIILLFTNMIIDYTANMCTVSLLFLAAISRNITDILIVSFSNIMLTITIFSAIFPLGIMACYLFDSSVTPKSTLQLGFSGSASNMLLDVSHKLKYSVSLIKVQSASHDEDTPQNSSSLFIIKQRNASKNVSAVKDAAEVLGYDPSKGFVFDRSAIIENEISIEYFNLNFLRILYSVAFDAAELIRQNFSGMVHLKPIAVSLSEVYRQFGQGIIGGVGNYEGRVKCVSNPVEKFVYQAGPNLVVESLSAIAEETCGDKLQFAAVFSTGGLFSGEIRYLNAEKTSIPLALFFVSSFIISLLYYAGLLLIAAGLELNRLLSLFFSSELTRREEIPFTLMSILIFLFIQIIILFRWLTIYSIFS